MAAAVSRRALSLWLRRLASADPIEAERARDALLAAGDRALPALIDALDADETARRLRVISMLSLLGSRRAAGAVAALLHDPSEEIRARAAGALARIHSQRCVPALVALLGRESVHRVRWAAVRSLVRLVHTGHEEALRPVLEVVNDPGESSRIRATALGAIPWLIREEDDSPARALLRRLASDDDPLVAGRAQRMLDGGVRPRLEPWAIDRLIEDLASRKPARWRRAVALLAGGGGAVVEPLAEAMLARAADAVFVPRAGLVLRELSSRQLSVLSGYLEQVEESQPLRVMVEVAAEVGGRALLAQFDGLIRRLARPPHVHDPRMVAVRARAHLALAQAGSRMAVGDLRQMLCDVEVPISGDLIDAVSIIGTRSELSPLLRGYLRSRGTTRLAIRDAVLTIARREGVRRTDRMLRELSGAEQRAAGEILGAPGRRKRRRPAIGGSQPSLLG